MCGLDSEEYLHEAIKSLPAEENVTTGFHRMGEDFWEKIGDNFSSGQHGQVDWFEFNHAMFKYVYVNQFLLFPDGKKFRVTEKPSPHKVVAVSFSHHNYKKVAEPRNPEQEMALELLMDTSVPTVSLAGMAGCGKTYLALAAVIALMERGDYQRVIVTRSTTNSDEEIGFLPGTECEKMAPWLGGISDNLKSLMRNNSAKEEEMSPSVEHLTNKLNLDIKALNFAKGSSYEKTLIIVDEAQDLDRRKLKMIITRVGEGSKIIFLGNVAQIDNRFVTENTCGLSILIRELAFTDLTGHITLQKGERSAIATLAEEVL
jgi:PhoH-like ATPase